MLRIFPATVSDMTEQPGASPAEPRKTSAPGRLTGPQTAAPPRFAQIAAVLAIVVAGLCGGLIGYAVMDLQCSDGCATTAGLVGVASAVLAAAGVAIVAVLTLRALSEWEATETARKAEQQ